MTVLLTILLVFAILIAFLLFLALITKKEYAIEREIVINKSTQVVFDYVKLIKNQEKYNVWVMKDPNVKIDYMGIDGTKGFVSAWEGNKQAGKGEQEIKEINNGKGLNIEIRFEKPFENIGQTYFTTTPVSENETSLKWQMIGKNKFPLNLMNLIIDGLLGKDMQKSLVNVKGILETI
ncbi:polyketide cyclase [Pedobacter polaris]|uniref:Polyketide cyclase n=1 Tax=Pedobacter polaris TaxID=2571273 RepID=A0A4U1CIM8_9SPHI|nr:SRPBCC family protein [Pedobacter polaris]TKC06560.1 polyketide cyclase [Pedobacter polaris]